MVASMPPVAHAPAPASYRVMRGDTLSQLALDFYGNAAKYPQIAAANPDKISDPNLIYTGETLKIPSPSHFHAAAVAPAPVTHVPKHAAYVPRHAKPSMAAVARHASAPVIGHVANGNVVQIARYLMNHGATKAAAAGIAACIWGESGGRADSVGSGGFGLIGWTGNTTGLPAGYHGPTGNKAYDMSVQLAGVVGYINAFGGFGPINAAGGPVAAAEIFSSHFEKPAVMFSDIHFGGAGDPTAIYNAI